MKELNALSEVKPRAAQVSGGVPVDTAAFPAAAGEPLVGKVTC
jgi:hypothetical protein